MKKAAMMFAILCMIAAFSGCADRIRQPSSLANQEAALRNPPVDTYPTPAIKSEGSIFSDDARLDMFADMKARRVGDIITVNIVETARATKTANTTTGRNNQVTAGIDSLLGYESPAGLPLVGGVFGAVGQANFGIEAGYASAFTGRGQTSRNETMTAKVSARVVQVLPNGNLVVRGSQEIMVNNEKHYITVQGVARPADVGADNTVLSTYLADARIDYTGEGDLSRKQREGWLSRFLDFIWPF